MTYDDTRTPLLPECIPCLGTIDDVPEYQQRPFILAGYRLNTRGCVACVRSAFALHNETVNIWSHFGGAFIVLVWATWGIPLVTGEIPLLMALHGAGDRWTISLLLPCFLLLVTLSSLLASAWYHTRHCDEEKICYGCFYIDMACVIILLAGSLIVGLSLAFKCFPYLFGLYLAIVVGSTVSMGAAVMLPGVSDAVRAVVFAVAGNCCAVPAAIHWLFMASREEVHLFAPYLIGMFMCHIGGATLYVKRIPEKWSPGRYDLFGQSHNILHFAVLAGMLIYLEGIWKLAQVRQECVATK